MIVGASADPVAVLPPQRIRQLRIVKGLPSGTAADSQDTLNFGALAGVRPVIQTMPVERAAEGYDMMMNGRRGFGWFLLSGAKRRQNLLRLRVFLRLGFLSREVGEVYD